MPGLTLAAINPDNTPHGYNLTFAFPLALFAVVALVLYLLFSRPHRRVPARRMSPVASSAAPAPDFAPAASVACGLSLAPGGGTTESRHEPTGAHLAASVNPEELAPESDPGDAEPGDAKPRPPQVGQGWQTKTTDGDEETPEGPE